MLKVGFICLIMVSLATGATWFPSPYHSRHRVVVRKPDEVVVVKFEEQGQEKNTIGGEERQTVVEDNGGGGWFNGPREIFRVCAHRIAVALRDTQNMVFSRNRKIEEEKSETKGKLFEKVSDGEKVGDPKGKLFEKLSGLWETVGDPKGKLFEKLSNGFKSVWETVGDPKGKLFEKLFNGFKSVREDVGDSKGKLYEKVSSGFKSIGENVGDPKGKLYEKVSDGFKSVGENVGDPKGKLYEKVSDGFKSVGEKVGDPRGKLSEKISNGIKSVEEKVGVPKGKLSEKLSNGFKSMEEKVGVPKGKLCEKLSDGFKSVGEKARQVAGNALTEKISDGVKSVGETGKKVVGSAKATLDEALGDRIGGTLKDSVDKMENWDLVDSPKRIGEDIERNVSEKIEQRTEEVKETVQNAKETTLGELLHISKKKIRDVLVKISVEKLRSVISWCHLFGFSIAYGTGVWFTFISSCVLGKCLPKENFGLVLNKMYMVYCRAMAYCVGAALLGYVVSRGTKGINLSNKMEMFQGFNLLSALLMTLTNLIFLEPRASELTMNKMKIQDKGGRETEKVTTEKKDESYEKLKKLNAYSSTLNVSTLVVLTWHLAYIGQCLQTKN